MAETGQNDELTTNDKLFEATLFFQESWQVKPEGINYQRICHEDIVQWALTEKLSDEATIRRYVNAVMPKGSQRMIYPAWKTQELEELKDLIAKYWIWLYFLDDILEKSTPVQIRKFSVKFASTVTCSNKADDGDERMDDDSKFYYFIESYVNLMNDLCDKIRELHPHITLEDIFQFRKQCGSLHLQFLSSVLVEVNEADTITSVSDFIFHKTHTSGVIIFWVFSAAKNGIINLCRYPKEFSSRLNQIYSLLAFFVGMVNDGNSYYRDRDEGNLFNIMKFWAKLQYVESEQEGYNFLKWQLDKICDASEHLLASFEEDYSHISGVKEHIQDLKYEIVGFVDLHLTIERYKKSPFLLRPAFGGKGCTKVKEKPEIIHSGYLQDLSQMFDVKIVRPLENLTF